MTVNVSGTYTLTSSSSIDTYGCVYYTFFDPLNPYDSLLTCDDESGGYGQFRINRYLQSETIYLLLVTTHSSNCTGSFVITGSGALYLTAYSIQISESISTSFF